MKSFLRFGLLALWSVGSCAAVLAQIGAPAVSPAKTPARKFAVVALPNPRAIAADRSGNLYVGDVEAGAVYKITPAGEVVKLGEGGPAIKDPIGLSVSRDGTVFAADADDNAVFKISAGGAVAKFGRPSTVPTEASFTTPTGVAVDAAGNVFVTNNGNNAILKVAADGMISFFAGKAGATGSVDGKGDAARFATPRGIAIDAMGNLYVADEGNSNIRKITAAGVVTTLAGTAGQSGSADGSGAEARFGAPRGLTVDAAGNVYVADTDNHIIRKITRAGVVTTIAGYAGEAGGLNGAASAARFSEPRGIAVDAEGNIFVADTGNAAVRQITPEGVVTTIAAGTRP